MKGLDRLRSKRVAVGIAAALSLLLIAAPPAIQALSPSSSYEQAAAPATAAPASTAAREQAQAETQWADQAVPQAGASTGAVGIGLLLLLTVVLLMTSFVMRSAQLPGLSASGAEVKRRLDIVAEQRPQPVDASHAAMLRG